MNIFYILSFRLQWNAKVTGIKIMPDCELFTMISIGMFDNFFDINP